MAAMRQYVVAVAIPVAVLSVTLTGTFILRINPGTKKMLFRVQMFALFSIILFFQSRFVWSRLVQLLPRTSKSRLSSIFIAFSKVTLVVFLLLGDFSVLIARILISSEPRAITKLAYSCLGLQLLLCFNLLTTNVFFIIFGFFQPLKSRKSLSRIFDVVASVLSVVLCFTGLVLAARPPEVVKLTVPLSKLPLSLSGTKVVQISDIHLGSTAGKVALERIVDIVNQQDPDIVVITGDLVDGSVEVLEDAVQPLKLLRSTHGVFFVTGNHEYIHDGDVDEWLITLNRLGVKPLHNSHVLITSKRNPDDMIYLAGVDDIQADAMQYKNHGMKLLDALRGRDKRYPTVLLVHQPHGAKLALKQDSDIDLVLSGHTHGGQFFPLHIPIYLYNPFFAGLYRHKKSFIYISSGTVLYGLPLRIGSRSEITIFTLVSEQDAMLR